MNTSGCFLLFKGPILVFQAILQEPELRSSPLRPNYMLWLNTSCSKICHCTPRLLRQEEDVAPIFHQHEKLSLGLWLLICLPVPSVSEHSYLAQDTWAMSMRKESLSVFCFVFSPEILNSKIGCTPKYVVLSLLSITLLPRQFYRCCVLSVFQVVTVLRISSVLSPILSSCLSG